MTHETNLSSDIKKDDLSHSLDLTSFLPEKQYDNGPYIRWLRLDDVQLKEILAMVGKAQIIGNDVVGYAYYPTAETGQPTYYSGVMSFTTPQGVSMLLEGIADMGMMNEFPNNFKIRLILEADTQRMLLIDYESEEEPEICEACEPDHLNDQYSCDHGTDFHSYSYAVSVGPKVDEDELDSLLVWF